MPRGPGPPRARAPRRAEGRAGPVPAASWRGPRRRAAASCCTTGRRTPTAHIHYGHILNKILKDIVVKSARMGLPRAAWSRAGTPTACPSSWRSSASWGGKRARCQPAEVRAACRDYALKFVGIQRAEFERLGVFGQWDAPYLTLDPDLRGGHRPRAGRSSRAGGFLYRGKKPVYWCARDQDRAGRGRDRVQGQDLAVGVRALRSCPPATAGDPGRRSGAGRHQHVALPIWTTTPWTLPANLAIVLHRECRTWRCPRPGRPGERPARRARAGREVPRRDRRPGRAGGVGRDRAPRSERWRACGTQHPFIATPASAQGVPGVVRRLRHHRRRAPAWSTPPPATAPTTTAPAPGTTSTRTRPSTRAAATSTA
jgi:hypothetical protein